MSRNATRWTMSVRVGTLVHRIDRINQPECHVTFTMWRPDDAKRTSEIVEDGFPTCLWCVSAP